MKRSAAVVAALCAVAAVLAAPYAARATTTTYYVDCAAGSDGNSGTSTATAWRTLTKASSVVYGPGDQILLKRGCVFAGQSLVAQGSGSSSARITLADYGTGNLPRIDASNAEAVKLQNVQNWTVKNLDLTQHGQEPEAIDANNEHGKDRDKSTDTFMHPVVLVRGLGPPGVQACGEPCTVRNITLDGLRVHDGTWTGIFVEGGYYDLGDNTYGYADNVVIQNSEAWGNHKAGIEFTDTYTKDVSHNVTNVKVLNSYLHHNGGDGIMMGPVDHGLIDSNRCSYNGWERNARLGCWSWDSHDVVSQFNESDHNQTPLNDSHARDAGGFDLDLGTEDSVMQYDWSHDNQGEGFLLLTWPIGFGYNRGVTHNAQLRYSISERDAKKLARASSSSAARSPHGSTTTPSTTSRPATPHRRCLRPRAARSACRSTRSRGRRRSTSSTTSSSATARWCQAPSTTSSATRPAARAPMTATSTTGSRAAAART